MIRYVLSYDVLTNESLKKDEGKTFACKNFEGDDFRIVLIETLCKIDSITSIDWKNNTTITIDSNKFAINAISKAINSLGYCIDYYLAKIDYNDTKKKFIKIEEIRKKSSVKNFNELVEENCSKLKKT